MEHTYENVAALAGRAAGPLASHLGPFVTSLIDQQYAASVIYIKITHALNGVGAVTRGRGGDWRIFQVDPWEKAADCERALRLTIDPVHRENLTNIREFWISLANARPFLSHHEFAKEADAIGRLHAGVTAATAIH
jgi:hypothetical protein